MTETDRHVMHDRLSPEVMRTTVADQLSEPVETVDESGVVSIHKKVLHVRRNLYPLDKMFRIGALAMPGEDPGSPLPKLRYVAGLHAQRLHGLAHNQPKMVMRYNDTSLADYESDELAQRKEDAYRELREALVMVPPSCLANVREFLFYDAELPPLNGGPRSTAESVRHGIRVGLDQLRLAFFGERV